MAGLEQVAVNGREYQFPDRPLVVVCIDGSEPDYHRRAVEAGRMPYLASLADTGTNLTASCVIPSFTNPNNLSIATGVPPAVHGICGNTFLDPGTGVELMMNDPGLLRAPTIFSAFEQAGADVAVITAKDKLRRLLGHGLKRGIRFSAEKADQATGEANGISDVLALVDRPLPSVYSADLSEFVMAAGVRILADRQPQVMYLSLTDWIQHRFAPGTGEADAFYGMLDGYFAQLDELGATLVVTADHGMNAKTGTDGSAEVVYVQECLDRWLPPGESQVVLPITDPYTRHHGSLGSFALVYLDDPDQLGEVAKRLRNVHGIDQVVERHEAGRRFELPTDRIGDLVLIAERHVVLGKSADEHDLSELDRPLRSHGGLSEQVVPLIVNRRSAPLPPRHQLRNFDAYWLGLNHIAANVEDHEPERDVPSPQGGDGH